MPNEFRVGANALDKAYVGSNEVDTIYLGINELYTSAIELDVPQNLSIDNLTLSWDEVEHAEEYVVFADGTSIGTTDGA